MTEVAFQDIFSAGVKMDSDGVYHYSVVDYADDRTHEGEIPEQYVSMVQGFLQQMRAFDT